MLTEKIGSNLTSFHTLTFYLFITDHIFLMQCCVWQHTALSLLIFLNDHSAVVDRSPFPAAVTAFSPLLCLLFPVVLTDLGRLSLTPFGRPLPMMMCITNATFREIPTVRLSKTHEIMKIADLIVLRTPPSLCTSPTDTCSMDPTYEIRGHVTPLVFAPSNFRHSTSLHLLLATQKLSSESWGTQKGTQKTFKPTLLV